jgi:hypothetical protein
MLGGFFRNLDSRRGGGRCGDGVYCVGRLVRILLAILRSRGGLCGLHRDLR